MEKVTLLPSTPSQWHTVLFCLYVEKKLNLFTSCPAVISFPCSPPPSQLPPLSRQQKLLSLPEGLLSNISLPRHSELVCVCVCIHTVLQQPPQHCCLGTWQFLSIVSFGKRTTRMRVCDRVHTGNPRELTAQRNAEEFILVFIFFPKKSLVGSLRSFKNSMNKKSLVLKYHFV